MGILKGNGQRKRSFHVRVDKFTLALMNRRLVLKTIWERGAINKAEIARRTGLSLPTAIKITDELLDNRIVRSCGRQEGASGKRPEMYEFAGSAYKGKKIVLYFYPKDSTSGCTAQACNLRDNYSELRKAGYEVIGVSVDNEKSHQKFIEKNNLPFTLIADTDKKLVEEFGVWGEKKLYGRAYMGTFRTTFLINEEGIVERIITPKEVKTKEHASQILNQ